MKINIGDKIEDIELPDSYANIFKLSSLANKWFLITIINMILNQKMVKIRFYYD